MLHFESVTSWLPQSHFIVAARKTPAPVYGSPKGRVASQQPPTTPPSHPSYRSPRARPGGGAAQGPPGVPRPRQGRGRGLCRGRGRAGGGGGAGGGPVGGAHRQNRTHLPAEITHGPRADRVASLRPSIHPPSHQLLGKSCPQRPPAIPPINPPPSCGDSLRPLALSPPPPLLSGVRTHARHHFWSKRLRKRRPLWIWRT